MAYAYGNSVDERKQALIKKLSGQNQGSGGGASRLSNGMPFGALPRLGFSPNVRSVFGRPGEQFNFDSAPQGVAQGLSRLTGPGGAAQGGGGQPLGGVGPAAGGGGSPGLPQGNPSQQFSAGSSGGTSHLLEGGIQPDIAGTRQQFINDPTGLGGGGNQGQLPGNVQQFLQGGALSGGVAEWLRQNPWALGALGGQGGGLGPVL